MKYNLTSRLYKLQNNIDCINISNFLPIGNNNKRFVGEFYGQNNTISNLFINRTGEDYIGFFGYMDGSNVTSVGLINVNISGNDIVAGLSGYLLNGKISESYLTGEISGKN